MKIREIFNYNIPKINKDSLLLVKKCLLNITIFIIKDN